MDTAGSMFTGLTLASIITTGGLTINLTENFGKLANDGSVKQEVDGNRLVGVYGNVVTCMSSVVIGLSALYLVFFIYGWYQKRGDREARLQRVYWLVMLLAVVLGVASAGVNLNLTENFLAIDDVVTDPNPVVPYENYKLRGSYGMATLSMASISLGMAGLAFIWMGGLYINYWKDMGKYSLKTNMTSSRRELDFSSL